MAASGGCTLSCSGIVNPLSHEIPHLETPENSAKAPARIGTERRLRRGARVAIYGAALLILAATLFPTSDTGTAGAFECLICGDRGLADAILNTFLFMPLGAAIALLGGSTRVALLLAFSLSAGVETVQMLLIPGRDASFGDLLFNTIGGMLGVTALRTAHVWLFAQGRRAARLSLLAACLAALIVAAPGLLLRVVPTEGTYFVMLNPKLRHLDPFTGSVHSISLADTTFTSLGIIPHTRLASAVRDGAPVTVRFAGGSETARPSAIAAVHDGRSREVLLVGFDRKDLIVRFHSLAAAVRLDRPDIRVRGVVNALAAQPQALVSVRRVGGQYCIRLGNDESCAFGYTAGIGWALLMYLEDLPWWCFQLLTVVWLAVLAFPVGFWIRPHWEAGVALLLISAAMLLLPTRVGLLPTPLWQLAGAVAGLAAGFLARRFFGPGAVLKFQA